ncbi:hypothetical protein JRO89_XS10G0174600 [Xanthoceras sorbifolium]|uniref:Uncharacterized protein n=1 Tax=Xanthoceras sorbifolium TaxID=99658 RepID=A0ABQ8HJ54_9ROSI|nr:hypothetical protein JRO89_XS10G0174600 [Xanthoceras sorbifolium]
MLRSPLLSSHVSCSTAPSSVACTLRNDNSSNIIVDLRNSSFTPSIPAQNSDDTLPYQSETFGSLIKRAPCCDKANVKKGPWSPEEDSKLKEYIEKYGTGGNWIALPQKAASHLLNNNSNTSMATANSTQFQIQEGQLVGNSIQFYNNNPMKENFLMFGSDQTSCSSSDGSCGQISYGNKEIKQEDQMGFQGGYNYSNGFEENHKFMLSYGSNNSNSTSTGGDQNQIYSWAAEKTNGFFGEPPTPPSHYSTLEDVKQLISSGCVNGYHHDTDNNDNNNFFTDANKYCYYYNY